MGFSFLSCLLAICWITRGLVAQRVKRLPAMWESRVRLLGWEDPLEKERATHSSTLAWRIPWTEEPGRLQPMGSQRVGHNWATSLSFLFFHFPEVLQDEGKHETIERLNLYSPSYLLIHFFKLQLSREENTWATFLLSLLSTDFPQELPK